MLKQKKLGFTLTEMIIVVALITVVLGIISSMFITGNKVFSDSDVKSTLQIEAQTVQEKISNIGMQASKIDKITLMDKTTLAESEIEDFGDKDAEKNYNQLTDLFTDFKGDKLTGTHKDNEKYLNIKEITIAVKEEIPGAAPTDPSQIEDIYYTIMYEQTGKKDDLKAPRGRLIIKKQGETDSNIIGENVESITIKPGDFSGKLSQANSIELRVNLAKAKGFTDVEYSIPVNVYFRNKTSY